MRLEYEVKRGINQLKNKNKNKKTRCTSYLHDPILWASYIEIFTEYNLNFF